MDQKHAIRVLAACDRALTGNKQPLIDMGYDVKTKGDVWRIMQAATKHVPASPQHVRYLCDTIGGQTCAADILGVSSRTVRRWVSGSSPIPRPALLALRAIAGVK
jgi:hypothetical protein